MTVTVRAIGQAVAEIYGIDWSEITGPSEAPTIAAARKATIWGAAVCAGIAPEVVARICGGRSARYVIEAVDRMRGHPIRDPRMAAVEAAVTVLARLGETGCVQMPPELDPVAIAERVLGAPGAAVRVSVDELRTLAGTVWAYHAAGAHIDPPPPDTAVRVPVIPAGVTAAIEAVTAAARRAESARYGRDEGAAVDALIGVSRQLQRAFESKE